MTAIETIAARLRREAHDLHATNCQSDAATAGLMTEAADMIEAQAREIERLRNPWQPIETAPNNGTPIRLSPTFSHWMPIPEPPRND